MFTFHQEVSLEEELSAFGTRIVDWDCSTEKTDRDDQQKAWTAEQQRRRVSEMQRNNLERQAKIGAIDRKVMQLHRILHLLSS